MRQAGSQGKAPEGLRGFSPAVWTVVPSLTSSMSWRIDRAPPLVRKQHVEDASRHQAR